MKIPTTAKTLLLVRHGITEMNVYLGTSGYGTPGFVDPGKWDTRLTPDGEAQAKKLRTVLQDEQIDLLVSSPLTRALMTADLAFGDDPAAFPRIAQPFIAERRWLSSDVGRSPAELSAEFGHYDLSALGETWWWEGDDAAAAAARAARAKLQGVAPAELRGVAMAVEPNDVFLARLRSFCYWLDARPEQRIAVVAHWGVFYSLLGRSLKNCELVRMRSDELPAELTDSPGD